MPLRVVVVFVGSAFAAEPALAACPSGVDADGDGYPADFVPGCVRDCDDTTFFVNPGRQEEPSTDVDDNCNGRKQMVVRYGESFFAPPAWVDSGSPLHLGDTLRVLGNTSSAREVLLTAETRLVVALDVETLSGTGCAVELDTREPSEPPAAATTSAAAIPGIGVQFLHFPALSPPEFVETVRVTCAAGSTVGVDWLQLQDAEVEFPPAADLDLTWRDTRAPAGGQTTVVVRDDRDGTLWMGSDMAGVARFDGGAWRIANGWGAGGLAEAGMLGVAEILPLQDGSGEVYALMGDVNRDTPAGGLWLTLDGGGAGSWIGVATFGGGAWRGELSW